ncbi:MAG TPA: DUF115 domain-containing protein, partial [Methanothrix sp.]|nr:DUF115 domain-containing protein [Methanothrix sp.]
YLIALQAIDADLLVFDEMPGDRSADDVAAVLRKLDSPGDPEWQVAYGSSGDNLAALREYVPKLTKVLATTQAAPLEGVYNFGGFTDGDRAVFLARRFGAKEIRMVGFDYDDPTVTAKKKKKLAWARRLVAIALVDRPDPPAAQAFVRI